MEDPQGSVQGDGGNNRDGHQYVTELEANYKDRALRGAVQTPQDNSGP